jgi:hypothetical protein
MCPCDQGYYERDGKCRCIKCNLTKNATIGAIHAMAMELRIVWIALQEGNYKPVDVLVRLDMPKSSRNAYVRINT